jgi:hypothetical protein
MSMFGRWRARGSPRDEGGETGIRFVDGKFINRPNAARTFGRSGRTLVDSNLPGSVMVRRNASTGRESIARVNPREERLDGEHVSSGDDQ